MVTGISTDSKMSNVGLLLAQRYVLHRERRRR
jgi:hypothetical protein